MNISRQLRLLNGLVTNWALQQFSNLYELLLKNLFPIILYLHFSTFIVMVKNLTNSLINGRHRERNHFCSLNLTNIYWRFLQEINYIILGLNITAPK
jgi:hypothetical protein